MIQDLNPTTRCFCRTTNDAFPQDHAEWWEDPPPRSWQDSAYWAAGLAIWIGLAIFYWRYS